MEGWECAREYDIGIDLLLNMTFAQENGVYLAS